MAHARNRDRTTTAGSAKTARGSQLERYSPIDLRFAARGRVEPLESSESGAGILRFRAASITRLAAHQIVVLNANRTRTAHGAVIYPHTRRPGLALFAYKL